MSYCEAPAVSTTDSDTDTDTDRSRQHGMRQVEHQTQLLVATYVNQVPSRVATFRWPVASSVYSLDESSLVGVYSQRGLVHSCGHCYSLLPSRPRPQPAMARQQYQMDEERPKRTFRLVGRHTALVVGLATFALVVVVGLVVFFHLYKPCRTTPDSPRHAEALLSLQADQKAFNFDDIFNPKFFPKHFSGKWLQDKESLIYQKDSNVIVYDAPTGNPSVVVDNSTLTLLNTSSYICYVSADQSFALIAYSKTKVWRHSFTARYKIATLKKDGPAEVFVDFPTGTKFEGERLQFAGWSPKGHALSFVYKNNLYYQATPSSDPVQVTTSGDAKFIFNGIPDWLYEEDVLGSRVAHYWSPDRKHICFARFNDTAVPLIKFPRYGDRTEMYNDVTEIAYPKAGDITEDGQPGPNTVAELFIVSITSPMTPRALQPPLDLRGRDHYYTRVAWRDVDHVIVTWAVRALNRSIVTICNVNTLFCQTNLDLSVTDGWTDSPWPRPLFIDGGANYLTVLPRAGGSAGPWRQLALVTSPVDEAGAVTFLTTEEQEVTKVLAYDETNKLMHQTPCTGHQAPDTVHWAPGTRHRALGTRHQTPCTGHQAPDTVHWAPGTRHRALGTRHQTPCTGHQAPDTVLWAPGTRHRALGTRQSGVN
ncbi:hypothetical protein NP493_34g05000 [Ridgeia piscesae]|uniref:Dipeptidylpeptidase IV N-terminal domain-containing protein n=1 Tax=Ridgeia piscesae TaxID=27915 RepID=A0AAD9PCP7_RIDPI|nr:hypothetical protein NP493_34g05000 [Ridgeia piscesae]